MKMWIPTVVSWWHIRTDKAVKLKNSQGKDCTTCPEIILSSTSMTTTQLCSCRWGKRRRPVHWSPWISGPILHHWLHYKPRAIQAGSNVTQHFHINQDSWVKCHGIPAQVYQESPMKTVYLATSRTASLVNYTWLTWSHQEQQWEYWRQPQELDSSSRMIQTPCDTFTGSSTSIPTHQMSSLHQFLKEDTSTDK